MPEPKPAGRDSSVPPAVRLHLWEFQAVRDLVTIALAVVLVFAGYQMRSVTVPLLVALALAYLIEPVVAWACRRTRLSRVAAVSILLSTVGTALLVLVLVSVPVAISQTVNLVTRIRDGQYSQLAHRAVALAPEAYRDDLGKAVDWLDSLRPGGAVTTPEEYDGEETAAAAAVPDALPASRGELETLIEAKVAEASARQARSDRAGRVLGTVRDYADTVFGLFLGAVGFVLTAFLVPFYLWFFSVYWPDITGFLRGLIPATSRGRWEELLGAMDRAISGFVRGRITVAFLMGVMFAIGWKVSGVPYALALGLFAGAICIVPYLGGIAVPLAVGLLFFDQIQLPVEERMSWWGILLWPTLVFTVVQLVESYLLTPLIAGKAADLDPVSIVVAILAGGALAGVYGMLLAIPVAACAKILLTRVVLPRLRAFARGEVSDPLPFDDTA